MNDRNQQTWNAMLRRSWKPSQWFEEDDSPRIAALLYVEESVMWVYRKTGEKVWTTGFYSPDREWHADREWDSPDLAAERVHWLNGGGQ